jgi:1,4-dihydroxy-2-naphthoyl-CoA hydrolase
MSQPFADRFDAEVAKGFIRANDRLTGLPQYLGLRIVDVGPGTLRAEMAVREDLLTPFKTMHGGVISAVCDHVLGCVCYPLMARGQWAATTEFKLNLLAPVTQGVLAAQATVVSMSKALAVVRIEVANEERLVALAQGTVTIRDPKG